MCCSLFNAEYVNKCLQMLIHEKVVFVLMLLGGRRGGQDAEMSSEPVEFTPRSVYMTIITAVCSPVIIIIIIILGWSQHVFTYRSHSSSSGHHQGA